MDAVLLCDGRSFYLSFPISRLFVFLLLFPPSLSILPRDTFDFLHTACPLFGPLFLPLFIIFLLQRLQVVFFRLDSFRMPCGALPRARLPRNPFNTVFFPPDHGNFVPPFLPPSLLLWPFIPLRLSIAWVGNMSKNKTKEKTLPSNHNEGANERALPPGMP